MTTKKKSSKKSATKKASTKKAVAKKASAAKKASTKKSAAKKASTKKSAVKKASTTEKASTKKSAVKKASTTKKASAEKSATKKASAKKATTAEKEAKRTAAAEERARRSSAAAAVAARVLSGEDSTGVSGYGDQLVSGTKSSIAHAARVLDAILEQKPRAVIPIIDRYVTALTSKNKRAVQSSANALPQLAKIAPAKVARHLPRLKAAIDETSLTGRDGLVRTFANLCSASVAYQKRLEPELNKALREADAKTLLKWTEIVLPSLKGEPHAEARATVEDRLGRIPRAIAQKIADFLGVKLRVRYR